MATPFKNPRDGILYFRREVPEKLRAAFDGKQIVKVSLRTRDPIEAKAHFARENAKFEEQLADARRRIAEGILVSTPGALVRRWREGPAAGSGLSGSERLILTFMELDASVGGRHSAGADGKIYPPAILGPAINTDSSAVLLDKARFEKILSDVYGGDLEQTGTNWIRARWHTAQCDWSPSLAGPIARLRMFDSSAERFNDDELTKALLAVIDEKRTDDEDFNRARLSRHRPRASQSRLRPHMRLMQLFREWKAGNEPRPQTALEFQAAVEDFIDYAGDMAVSTVDLDLLYDYRDEAAKLPASMPRADRRLPFRERVAKHATTEPKCSPATLKKRIGALQALLTFAFQQRWSAINVGLGIRITGYTKTKTSRRSPARRRSRWF